MAALLSHRKLCPVMQRPRPCNAWVLPSSRESCNAIWKSVPLQRSTFGLESLPRLPISEFKRVRAGRLPTWLNNFSLYPTPRVALVWGHLTDAIPQIPLSQKRHHKMIPPNSIYYCRERQLPSQRNKLAKRTMYDDGAKKTMVKYNRKLGLQNLIKNDTWTPTLKKPWQNNTLMLIPRMGLLQGPPSTRSSPISYTVVELM